MNNSEPSFKRLVICPYCNSVFKEDAFEEGEGHICYICSKYAPRFQSWPNRFIRTFFNRLKFVYNSKNNIRELFIILYPSFNKIFLEHTLYRLFASKNNKLKESFYRIEQLAGGMTGLLELNGKSYEYQVKDISPKMSRLLSKLIELRDESIRFSIVNTDDEEDFADMEDALEDTLEEELLKFQDLLSETEQFLMDLHNWIVDNSDQINAKIRKLSKKV
ncbi:hypothetical protein KAJ27_25655 [bacterium]|nr:hypothetical protein [bacterium]